MKQGSLGMSNTVKRTRKREFLDAMELVVPWAELVLLVEPESHAPESGRRPATLCGAHAASHPRHTAMAQAQRLGDGRSTADVPAFRYFAGLAHWDKQLPSESSILRFRHLLERHKLAE